MGPKLRTVSMGREAAASYATDRSPNLSMA